MDILQIKRTIDALYEKANGQVDGITISGGEPFEQVEELLELVSYLRNRTDDILVFTGKKKESLEKNELSSQILAKIAVLVDGEYIEAQNEGEVLRGSNNQNIHILNKDVTEMYASYQKENNGKHLVENFRVSDGVVAVGIHKKDFKNALATCLETKDIIKKDTKG